MVNWWRRYIKHPLFIGTILGLLVIFIFANFLPSYITEKIEDSKITNNGEVYYFDLNHDGNSEKLSYYHYDRIFQPTLYLYDSNEKLITLWNFLESPIKNFTIFSGDYNNDNRNEIYVFTTKTDSVFLYILEPEKDKEPLLYRRYITSLNTSDTSLKIESIGLFNLDGTDNKEFLFILNAGYPYSPRKIFAFNIDDQSLKSSPELGADIQTPIIIEDINNDNALEIIINNKSVDIIGTGNRAQLIILNSQLEYHFQPKDFFGGSSQISVKTVSESGKKTLAVLHSGNSNENVFNNLMLFTPYGVKTKEVNLTLNSNLVLIPISDNENNLFLLSGKQIYKYSPQLYKLKTYRISKDEDYCFISERDIVGNEEREYVFGSRNNLLIISENFRYSAKIGVTNDKKLILTDKNKTNKIKALSIQGGEHWQLVEIYENKAFFYGAIFYLITFFIVTFSVFGISRLKFNVKNLKKSLLGKNEEELLQELEENLKDKFTDLKSHVDEIGDQISGDSYEKILNKIDDTYNDVKSISKNGPVKKRKEETLKQRLLDIINKRQVPIKPVLQMFSEDNFTSLNKLTKDTIVELCSKCIGFIANYSNYECMNIQLMHHSEYINVLFEIEGLFIDPENLEKNLELDSIVKRINSKLELANIKGYGTIINVSVPLNILESGISRLVKRIKVIIAEDHDVSLFGLISLFKTKEDIEIIGTAKNGMEVIKLLETNDVDVVITDISMPGMDGIELTERLKNEHPQIKVVVFTMYMENWFVEQLINHGAKGFVSKNSKTIELVGAVRSVVEGNNYYCPQFKSKFGFKGNNNGIKQKLDSLSKNELHIVKQYAENLTKEQIAAKMDLSTKTIDNFVANILIKLNAGDEDEIIRIAKKQKFVTE